MSHGTPRVLIAGLQRRLLVLVIAVLLPVFGFLIASGLTQRQTALHQAADNLQTMTRLVALSAERQVEGTRQLLNAVSSGPSLRNEGMTALCNDFLANIRSAHPSYTNLAFMDEDGRIVCHALKTPVSGSFKNRSYFSEATQNGLFAMGNYQIGEVTGAASVGFARPVYDQEAKLKGMAYAGLELQQIASALKGTFAPGVQVTLTDREGTVLGVDATQGAGGVGAPWAHPVLASARQTLPAKPVQAPDASGAMRLYAVATVADDTGPALYVVASVAQSAVTEPAWQALQAQLLWISATALLGILLARWIASRTLIEPARRLVQKINALQTGEANTPPAPTSEHDEMQVLSTAFDRFSQVITQRDLERDHQQKMLETVQARLLASQRIAKIGNWEFDLGTHKLWWSAQTFSLLGRDPADEPPSLAQQHQLIFPADLPRYHEATRQLMAGQRPLDLEVRVVLQGEQVRWFHVLGDMLRDGAGAGAGAGAGQPTVCAGTLQDITDRVVNERLMRTETRALKALAQDKPLKVVLDEVLIGLESILPGASTSVMLLSPDGQQLQFGAAPHLPDAYNQALEGAQIGPNVGSCGSAAHLGKTVVVEDIANSPLWTDYRELALAHGLRACWSIPLKDADGRVLATFAAYYREPRAPQPEELAWAHSAATLIGVAIQRDRHEADLRAVEQRFRNSFQDAATGMVISSLNGRLMEVNAAYCRMLGYCELELYELDIQALSHVDDWPRLQLQLIELIEGRASSFVIEKRSVAKSGEFVWFRYSVSLLRGASGQPEGFFGIAEDINQQRKAQTEVLQLNAELETRVQLRTAQLEAVNRELEAFSYSVSHDLRSPLNTINGFGQMLQKSNADRLTDKGKHYLTRIRAGTQQMAELIDGLLALAKLNRNALRPEVVDLSAIAQRVEQECREREPERAVALHVQPGLTVRGDATLLLLVMQNLLSNAWKYTSKQADARIDVGSQTTTGGEAIYFVRDNGAGFDMAHADKLFGAFQRLHAPSDFAGTGVGLANVKRVIERHGGQVWAEGRLQEGATFFFTIGCTDN